MAVHLVYCLAQMMAVHLVCCLAQMVTVHLVYCLAQMIIELKSEACLPEGLAPAPILGSDDDCALGVLLGSGDH